MKMSYAYLFKYIIIGDTGQYDKTICFLLFYPFYTEQTLEKGVASKDKMDATDRSVVFRIICSQCLYALVVSF